jgi:NAD(P)-dependent dehydrogenase (short-subunit alcohol dehydrogenase family)
LITGGASGIGEATAKLFAQHGARLVIADIQDKAGSAVCEELNAQTDVTYVHCDITHEPDVEKAVDTAVDRYGKLDIMFNNAGIIGSPVIQIIKSDKSNFEKVYENYINFANFVSITQKEYPNFSNNTAEG